MHAIYIDRKNGIIYTILISEKDFFIKQAGLLWRLTETRRFERQYLHRFEHPNGIREHWMPRILRTGYRSSGRSKYVN
jgi:hypothetical protein